MRYKLFGGRDKGEEEPQWMWKEQAREDEKEG